MKPLDLLRRYFTATGIGQVRSRMSEVDGLVMGVSKARRRNSHGFVRSVPDLPSVEDARNWARQVWPDVGDAFSRRF